MHTVAQQGVCVDMYIIILKIGKKISINLFINSDAILNRGAMRSI